MDRTPLPMSPKAFRDAQRKIVRKSVVSGLDMTMYADLVLSLSSPQLLQFYRDPLVKRWSQLIHDKFDRTCPQAGLTRVKKRLRAFHSHKQIEQAARAARLRERCWLLQQPHYRFRKSSIGF